PAPGVLEAIAAADAVLLAPSNPVVSLGPILSVPGLAAAVAAAPGGVVGVSPVIGGAVVRGMADACLAALAVPTAADAVGLRYGPRARARATDRAVVRSVFRDPDATRRDSAFIPPSVPENGSTSGAYDRAGEAGLLDGWLIAEEDAALAPAIEAAGLPVRVLPLWMRDAPTSTALAAAAIETALEARAAPSPV
ncbi:MAG: YvcK family protein, partial [Microbacteriaceae bacterium]|nr:YvcK family protein [Microbacteriaceae bacterium]